MTWDADERQNEVQGELAQGFAAMQSYQYGKDFHAPPSKKEEKKEEPKPDHTHLYVTIAVLATLVVVVGLLFGAGVIGVGTLASMIAHRHLVLPLGSQMLLISFSDFRNRPLNLSAIDLLNQRNPQSRKKKISQVGLDLLRTAVVISEDE